MPSATSSLSARYSTSSTLFAILIENDYYPLKITPAFFKSMSKILQAELPGSSEYLLSIQKRNKVKHENKGTRKRRQPVDKGQESRTKRRQKLPQPIGDIRNPPCKRCRDKELTCYSQAGGNACVSCVKIKIRCSTKAVVKREKKPAIVNTAQAETTKRIGHSPPSQETPVPHPQTNFDRMRCQERVQAILLKNPQGEEETLPVKTAQPQPPSEMPLSFLLPICPHASHHQFLL
jgi:hypothetical protein